MPPNPNVLTGYIDGEQAILDANTQEVRNVIATNDSQAIKNKFNEIERVSTRYKDRLNRKVEQVESGSNLNALSQIEGRVGDDTSLRHHVKIAEIYVKQVLEAYKSNTNLISVALNSPGGRVIRALAAQIPNPSSEISPESSLYVYQIIFKAINNQVNNPLTVLEPQEFNHLRTIDSVLAEKVFRSLIESARQIGVDAGEIRKFEQLFLAPPTMNRFVDREGELRRFRETFGRYYDERDKALLEAIFIPSKFIEYIDVKKSELAQTITDDYELKLRLSRDLKNEIGLLYSKLTRKLDNQSSEEFYEEIVKRDFYHGIEPANIALSSAIDQLTSFFENNKEEYKGTFFIDGTIREDGFATYKTEDGNEVKKPYFRIQPGEVPKEATIYDFVQYCGVVGNVEFHTREYTHNVKSLFLKPAAAADKGGFYGQLGDYAEKMKATDMDEITTLPDSDAILDAFHLYDKFLWEEFAYANWIHPTDLFAAERGAVRTRVEEEVLDSLKKMYPDLAKRDDWRLRRCLSIAVGMSKGVIMNEVEVSSYAEPSINQDGSVRYDSYYTHDPFALTPLNPYHFLMRWQSQDSLRGPLLFMPVEGIKQGMIWDHTQLWKKMQEYQQAYLSGKKVITDPGQKLLLDYMMNIGKVGGVIQRAGWRDIFGYEGWFSVPTPNLGPDNYLENWKRIENIGYEALLDYSEKRIKEDFWKTDSPKRTEFFKYIYKKYINPQVADAQLSNELNTYIDRLRVIAKKTVEDKIIKGNVAPAEKDSQIEIEMSSLFYHRGLAGVIANRFPSKFLKYQRDRWTDDGKRIWDRVRIELGSDDPDWVSEAREGSRPKGLAKFDRAMKNLSLAETLLRKQISDEMIKITEKKGSLDQVTGEYRLTEKEITTLLKKTNPPISDADLADVLTVFKKIKQELVKTDKNGNTFLDNFGTFIKNKEYPFAFGTEELDTRFLAFRGAGNRVLARAIKDIGGVETKMTNGIFNYFNELQKVALDPKHDISPLLGILQGIRDQMYSMHGSDATFKVIHHLALMTINYYKKDTLAKNIGGLFTSANQKNSLAAEFARSSTVWEWSTADIDNFIIALEGGHNPILPKNAIDLALTPNKGKYVTKYFGRIKVGNKVLFSGLPYKVRQDFENYNSLLRKDGGATGKHIALDLLVNKTPLLLLILLFFALKKGLEELTGGGGHK